MTKKTILYSFMLLFFFSSCSNFLNLKKECTESINRNVCKSLDKKTVVYAIFVDSKQTGYWSDYEIGACLDSINKATKWICEKAKGKGFNLNILVEYPRNEKGIIPISKSFSRGGFSETLYGSEENSLEQGINLVDRWSDQVSKICGKTLPRINADSSYQFKTIKDLEMLIFQLRSIYQTDNIAVMFFINEYYSKEISASFHCSENDKTEFSIVSDKTPGVIAHEFLHLFGAIDYSENPFDQNEKRGLKRKEMFYKYRRDIMYNPYKNLSDLQISPLTQYFIGWRKHLSTREKKLISKTKNIVPNH